MKGNAMLLRLAVVCIAMLIGLWVSLWLANKTIGSNRAGEWPENEKSEPLSNQALHWTIVHIRDDIGCIQSLLWIANTLLAGILGALVAQFL
jgi:hypothetical protein